MKQAIIRLKFRESQKLNIPGLSPKFIAFVKEVGQVKLI
jgi:hypothetical protein